MSERRRLFFKNGIILAAVGLLTRSVALFFNSYISKTIGAEGMGLFGLIMSVYSFAVTFATSGISLTVTKLTSSAIGSGEEKELSRIFRSALGYSLVFSAAATAVLFFGADYFALRLLSDTRAASSIRILSLSLVPLSLSSTVSGYFVGVRRVSKNAFVSVISQFSRILLTVLLLSRADNLSAEEGAYTVSLVMTLTELLSLLLSFLQYALDKRSLKAGGRKRHFNSVCNMALPLAVSAYIRSALLTLEHALIPRKLREGGSTQEEALSSYGTLHGMALPLILFPMSPLSSFSGLLVPEFSESLAKGEKKRLSEIAGETVSTTLKYALGVASVFFIFSEELGYAFYSSYEAGRYIAFLAPVVPIMYLDHVTDSILKGIGEQVYSMWVNISDSFLSLVLVSLLIPRLGIIGYALVILIMEAYNFTLSFVRLYKKIPFKIELVKSLVLPIVSGLLCAFLTRSVFIPTSQNTSPLWLVLKIVFALSVYVLLSLLLKKLKLPASFCRKHTNI